MNERDLLAACDKSDRDRDAAETACATLVTELESLRADLAEKERDRQDMAMLIRRFCHAMRHDESTLADDAKDYLYRKGLQGSPLR